MSKFSKLLTRCATRAVSATLLLAFVAQDAAAQAAKKGDAKKGDGKKADKVASADSSKAGKPNKPKVSKLFKAESPIDITFTSNFKKLRNEKRDGAPWHTATIAYKDSTGAEVSIPLRTRTRGIWRLANCDFPPLRLNFANKTSKATIFDDLDEPKLVSYCKRGADAEPFVLQELQLYRIYHLLTPNSHQTRLLRVTYVDSTTGKPELTRYAFIVEDPMRMAERAGGNVLNTKGATSEDLDAEHATLAFVFSYMVGNTDFSFTALHNGELLRLKDGRVLPVPYDFDFAGVINAPYATVDPSLRIRSVRDRQFRGYCAHRASYPGVLAQFEAKKAAIYGLYTDEVGKLIEPRRVKETIDYFDKFYAEIKTPKDLERNLLSECVDRR